MPHDVVGVVHSVVGHGGRIALGALLAVDSGRHVEKVVCSNGQH